MVLLDGGGGGGVEGYGTTKPIVPLKQAEERLKEHVEKKREEEKKLTDIQVL